MKFLVTEPHTCSFYIKIFSLSLPLFHLILRLDSTPRKDRRASLVTHTHVTNYRHHPLFLPINYTFYNSSTLIFPLTAVISMELTTFAATTTLHTFSNIILSFFFSLFLFSRPGRGGKIRGKQERGGGETTIKTLIAKRLARPESTYSSCESALRHSNTSLKIYIYVYVYMEQKRIHAHAYSHSHMLGDRGGEVEYNCWDTQSTGDVRHIHRLLTIVHHCRLPLSSIPSSGIPLDLKPHTRTHAIKRKGVGTSTAFRRRHQHLRLPPRLRPHLHRSPDGISRS